MSNDFKFPSVTVEFGSVVYEFNPSEGDEWQSDGEYDYHYDFDYNRVYVYRILDNGHTDTSNSVYSQPILKMMTAEDLLQNLLKLRDKYVSLDVPLNTYSLDAGDSYLQVGFVNTHRNAQGKLVGIELNLYGY